MSLKTINATPASAKGLLMSLGDLKTELGISGTSEDAYLNSLIARASSLIEGQLNVPATDKGSTSLGFATFQETFIVRHGRGNSELVLSRRPVDIVSGITVNGTELSGDDYVIDKASGIISRPCCANGFSGCSTVIVTYDAGWALPGESDANLPSAIGAAVAWFAKSAFMSKSRDPLAKSVWVLDVKRTDYWVGSTSRSDGSSSPFSQEIDAGLAPYRYEPV